MKNIIHMKSVIALSTLSIFLIIIGCNKEPGEGGTSSITGKVWVVDLNGSGDTTAQYYAMDEDVYIIYGDQTQTYSDNFNTSLDGSYRFDYLTPGKYTVFAYSDCETCPGGQDVSSKTVEITDKKQVIEVEDLVIIK